MFEPSSNEPQVNAENAQFSVEGDTAGMPAWTEIEEGRFLPRRVRGSCQGRALG
jgi:hypothetical protein